MRKSIGAACLIALLFVGHLRAQTTAPAAANAFHPDRLRLAYVLGDARLRHGGSITQITPLPDGKRVLTSAQDGTVRLWDLSTGKELRRYASPTGGDVWNVRLLPGGKEFLAPGEDKCVTRWDIEQGKLLKTYKHDAIVFRVAVAPDGKSFAAVDNSKKCILWDLESGEEIRRFKGHTESVYTAQFSPNGRTLITGGADEAVRFWNVSDGKSFKLVKEKGTGDVFTLTPSRDGSRMLVCTAKKSVWEMDVATGKCIRQADIPKGVKSAVWSPDENLIAAACDDEKLYVLNAKDFTLKWSAPLPGSTHYAVAFSSDGREVLCGASHLLCRFDAATGKRLYPAPKAHPRCRGVGSIVFVPHSRRILEVLGSGKGIAVWDVENRKVEATWLPNLEAKAIAVSSDGLLALVGIDGAPMMLLDARTGKVIRKIDHQGVRAVAFLPDGQRAVASGSQGGTALWDLTNGRQLRTFSLTRGSDDPFMGVGGWSESTSSLCVSPDGTRLLTTGYSGPARVWDVNTGKLLSEIHHDKKQNLQGARFVPAESFAIVSMGQNWMRYWIATGRDAEPLAPAEARRLIAELGARQYRTRKVATERLIRAGRSVLETLNAARPDSAEAQARVSLIRSRILEGLSSYKAAGSLQQKEDSAYNSFRFHPDGVHWAAVGGRGAASRITIGRADRDKLRLLRTIDDADSPSSLSFGTDGTLYVANRNGTIGVFRAP